MADPFSIAALATSAIGATSSAVSTFKKRPKQPKPVEQADPDDPKKRIATERDLQRKYQDQGRVGSLFNKDSLS